MSKIGDGVALPIMALAVVAALGACAETKQVTMEQPPPASAVLPEPALLQKGTTGEVDRGLPEPQRQLGLLHQGHPGPRDDLDRAGFRYGQGLACGAEGARRRVLHGAARRGRQTLPDGHRAVAGHDALAYRAGRCDVREPVPEHAVDLRAPGPPRGRRGRIRVRPWRGVLGRRGHGGRLRQGCDDRDAALGRRGRARRHQGLGPGYLQLLGRRGQRLQGVGRAVRHEA